MSISHAYERLTAADAIFLRIETPHEPQHVGSLSVIEGGPLRDASGRIRFDELQAHIARRMHRVPRLRQRVMEVPYNQGRPVWVDDEHFDIDYHVRLTALPRPGDDDQLAALMSRVQVIDNEGLTIAVVSYDDQLHVGITSDRDVMPDLGAVAASIEHEFAVLAKRR